MPTEAEFSVRGQVLVVGVRLVVVGRGAATAVMRAPL